MIRLLAVLLFFAGTATAQNFPTRPITMIVPYAAGGSADVVARPLAADMAKLLGENVVVELRPGAGGNIGAEYVARSARADGYTILMASLSLATNISLMKLSFDPRKELTAIGGITTFPNILVVSAQDPATSLKDIVARAKQDPGRVSYGSSGPGTSSHLAGELLSAAAGVELTHVPYKGSGAVYPDLIARRVTLLFDLAGSASGHIKGGQVKPLATTGARRAAALPDTPTFIESGFPGFQFGAWLGLFAPAETPKEILSRLEDALLKTVQSPDMKARLAQMGGEPVPGPAAQFWKFFLDDVERYAQLVRDGKVKPIQ